MNDHSRNTSPTQRASRKLNRSLERNIDALVERRRRQRADATFEDKIASAISAAAGSMMFVYIHLVVFGGWIVINAGILPIIPPWDPSLVVLAMMASVEAIFLSTFVLINQNRMARDDAERAELDLQISLLNEHETTRLIEIVHSIADTIGAPTPDAPEIEELERDISPEAVLDRLEKDNGSR